MIKKKEIYNEMDRFLNWLELKILFNKLEDDKNEWKIKRIII